MNAGVAERAAAARLLHEVLERGRTTDQLPALHEALPVVREMVLGSLRHYFSLSALVDGRLHRPLKPKDSILRALLIVGAYQQRHMRIPDHAALHTTVSACQALGRPWAKGLVNAVLRRTASLSPGMLAAEHSFEHPPWLEQALRAQYPDAEAIMLAGNQRAPMCLRINQARIEPSDYVDLLRDAGLDCRRPGDGGFGDLLGDETRVLAAPCPSAELPGYQRGLVAVQDAGAQLAAGLLAPDPGMRVLDACAAPGGKLFHLLERYPSIRATAIERSSDRLADLQQEAARLGHRQLTVRQADATSLDWWDGVGFDRILLDAPCTGTGTLRRHPDIKVLRTAGDVATLQQTQLSLLAGLWRALQPGGSLVYCTCSILAAENDDVISGFLADHADAHVDVLHLAVGRATRYGWQLLPTESDTDGFYYARMSKGPQ